MAGHSTLTDTESVPAPLCDHQVQRIVASSTFKSAPTLQQLFQFLATRALDDHPDEIKEYTIGVEALGRKPDFDPKTDPIVRVQVYRLRQKLKEYYETEGFEDSILVEVPKGHYLLSFKAMKPLASNLHRVPDREERVEIEPPDAPVAEKHGSGFSRRIGMGAIVIFCLAAFAAGFVSKLYLERNRESGSALRVRDISSDPVKAFWASFIREDPNPILAYADAVFLLDGSSDLFRFRHGASDDRGAQVDPHLARQFASNPDLVAKAGPLYYDNGYTGTGELEAVAMLTSLFTQMGAKPRIASSYDITTDDLKQHNVVLLGSPFQNVAVAQLPSSGDFLFQSPEARTDLWKGVIINDNPQTNEKSSYHTERDPATGTVKADYALISFRAGIVPGRHIVNLGGLDTKGTEGAVLLMTSRSGIEELSKALAKENLGDMSGFQALLKVNLEKGYQVLNSELLAVHPLKSEFTTPTKPPFSH